MEPHEKLANLNKRLDEDDKVGNNEVVANTAFIGLAPSTQGDKQQPFTGNDEEYFDRLLEFLGLDRQNAFITNVIKTPRSTDHINNNYKELYKQDKEYLEEELDIVRPNTVIVLGSKAGEVFDIYRREGQRKLFKKRHPASLHYNDESIEDYIQRFTDVRKHLNSSLGKYINNTPRSNGGGGQ